MQHKTDPVDSSRALAVYAAWQERKRTFENLARTFYDQKSLSEAIREYKSASLEFEKLRADLLK